MKKIIISSIIAIALSGCTMSEFQRFMTSTKSATTQTKQKATYSTSTDKVIRVKKNPNKGKKRVSVGGMKMPSQFSYDEDGDLQFTPKTSDRDIREYNRILQGTGIRIEGY